MPYTIPRDDYYSNPDGTVCHGEDACTGDCRQLAVHFAWPGGYEVFYLCDDGGTLCAPCVNDPSNPVHVGGDADGWRIDGHSHTGETDGHLVCDHCGRVIQEDWEDFYSE
jgi:hypothetical protein